MAFSAPPQGQVAKLAADDRLFLYATRGAWRNPTRDRGRIIGTAVARSAVRMLSVHFELAGRTFVSGCSLEIEGLVPYPNGLELQPLVKQLAAFPRTDAWSIYLRRALRPLPASDADLLDGLLMPMLASRQRALHTYPSLPGPVRDL